MIIIKFVIATVTYWTEKGYNPSTWRKSVDGTKAMCHLEYAEILAKNLNNNENVQIYDCASEEFKALLNSVEWTQDGTDELIEDNSLAAKVAKNTNDMLTTQVAVAELYEGGEV